eukprot:scaffold48923_cov39-Attheya_sp.AAC.1
MVMESSSTGTNTNAVPHQPQPQHRDGAVLKLHFCCRAELPMGSSLRVTGSTLWAPSSDLAAAEGDQEHPHQHQHQHQHQHHQQQAHASSVEMVTDPDRYPLWYTRRPVILVASNSNSNNNTNNNTNNNHQVHRYRYLVVSPGDDTHNAVPEEAMGMEATTSNERVQQEGALSPVTSWEDPFSNAKTASQSAEQDNTQAQSLLHLPFRTLHLPRASDKDIQ